MTITRDTAAVVARRAVDDTAGRYLDVVVMRWNTVARVSDDGGRTFYNERWSPGSLLAGERTPVYAGHVVDATGVVKRGPLIGRIDSTYDDGSMLTATILLADTATARDVHALADTVGATVSLEADVSRHTAGEIVRTQPGRLSGLAVLLAPERGAYPDARVLAARAAARKKRSTKTKETDMPDVLDPTDPPDPVDPVDPPVTPPTAVPGVPGIGRADVDELVRAAVARIHVPVGAPARHEAAQWPTFGDYAAAVYRGDADPAVIARAWEDQISADNPGVMPPTWMQEVKGIVDAGRPTVTAFGVESAGDTGLTLHFPYFDGDIKALVGNQTDEKTEIKSVKVSIKDGSTGLHTWAGGSDVSFQLRDRSSPAYMNAYMRIMLIGYNAHSDVDVAADVIAAGTGAGTVDLTTPATAAAALKSALFAASVDVEAATGQPAQFALVATDVFKVIGGIENLYPAPYGVMNVAGTADARTLSVNVNGLPVIHDMFLPDGTMIVSNSVAGGVPATAPAVVQATDVPKLGTDVAVWGLGRFAAYAPAGIVKITATIA